MDFKVQIFLEGHNFWPIFHLLFGLVSMRYLSTNWVIFDQWSKLHLGLDALSNQKILNGIYYVSSSLDFLLNTASCRVEK